MPRKIFDFPCSCGKPATIFYERPTPDLASFEEIALCDECSAQVSSATWEAWRKGLRGKDLLL